MSTSHLVIKDKNLFKDYFLNDLKEPIKYLPNFNDINILIGANNSGKSRFIRSLMSFQDFEFINAKKVVDYNELIEEYNSKVDDNNIKTGRQNNNKIALFQFDTDIADALSNSLRRIKVNNFFDTYHLHNKLGSIKNDIFENKKVRRRYYIPTLRTAHSLFRQEDTYHVKIEKDIFEETLHNYYASLKSNGINIFTGLHLHKKILNARNSKRSVREQFEKFEKFISKNFFNNKQIDIVAEFNKDESLEGKNISEIISVHIEGERETRKLYQLGDGIQAIIVLMYQIFMAEDYSFIYIDEPELNLHPGMQRLFLEQITGNKILTDKNLVYIITTHSNHFLDLTIEKENVSIYAFSPKENNKDDKQFTIRNVNAGDNSILKHLGVNNSSVFMANCSIWVEGISDRNYIKAFLKSYLKSIEDTEDTGEYKSIKEDIDFAFFEYAGSNIEHYVFDEEIAEQEDDLIEKEINSLALSNRIFLLADSDNASTGSAKRLRIEALEKIDGDNFTFKVLDNTREIENLLPNGVWSEVLINFCNKTIIKGREEEVQDKIDLILEKVNSLNYSQEYIGEFLSEINKNLKIDKKSVLNSIYKTKPKLGTFIPKRELSELVLKADLEWDVFKDNPEIEKLTKEIYNFILNKNT